MRNSELYHVVKADSRLGEYLLGVRRPSIDLLRKAPRVPLKLKWRVLTCFQGEDTAGSHSSTRSLVGSPVVGSDD